VFAPIWKYIYDEIESGEIISVDFVKLELEKKADDWRDDFFVRASGMFQISEDIEKEYAKLIGEIESRKEFRVNKQRERFLTGADPWVIALARHLGNCTVISAEKKSLADYGIGAVCKVLGVEHCNLVQFFEANNVGH